MPWPFDHRRAGLHNDACERPGAVLSWVEMNETMSEVRRFDLLRGIFRDTASVVGEPFLQAMVRGLGNVLDAKTTFVAYALDDPPSRVRVLAAWKNGAIKESWEYDLAGNPCLLTYNGDTTFIPCELARDFPNKRDSGYESYIGIPLKDGSARVIGHIAVYAAQVRHADDFAVELAELCGLRAEAEVRRLIADVARRDELQRLRDADRARGDMLAIASHDLRSPLSSVIGTLRTINAGLFGAVPDTVAEFLSATQTTAEDLLRMTDDILDEERIILQGIAVGENPIALTELVESSLVPLLPGADAARIDVRTEINETALAVIGDRVLLERLIGNLVANAIRFSPEGGRVFVSATGANGRVRISVTDRGPGVPAEDRERIFQRFFRRAPPGMEGKTGAGLGLSIAKNIAEAHEGTLSVEANPGGGARFIAELPLAS